MTKTYSSMLFVLGATALVLGFTTTTTYAQPNENANEVGECSSFAPNLEPGHVAHQCYVVRDDNVPVGGEGSEEGCGQFLVEPEAGVAPEHDHVYGAANFNCGHPSETNP